MKQFSSLNILKNISSVCLIGHENPDTDALSSMVVFREFLLKYMNVKKVDIFADCKNLPENYMPILGKVTLNKPIKKYQIAIMMDSTADDRLGQYSDLFNSAKTKIVIDHHLTNKYQGDINIVKITSSTCQIVYEILKYFKFDISKENKGKLYAGLITDTNNLSVGEIDSIAFKMAGEFVNDIDICSIYEQFLSRNTMKNMQLFSLAINNLISLNHGKILISHITIDEAKKFKTEPEDFYGIINRLATINGCRFVLFTYPKPEGYYASMRARHGYDVSIIAKKFGGGGHKGASAFNIKTDLKRTEENVVQEFMTQLEKSTHLEQKFKF